MVHYDLSPDNILLKLEKGKDGCTIDLRIIDLGSCKKYNKLNDYDV
jgi:Ser/Thr protein kinase RdoA (MazF antagonist)